MFNFIRFDFKSFTEYSNTMIFLSKVHEECWHFVTRMQEMALQKLGEVAPSKHLLTLIMKILATLPIITCF